MTDEEKIRKCIELVWDYKENYDGDDLLNFQNKELSTYTHHESVVATFNKYMQLEKENAELKAENKQIVERERVVPEHYLIEMIEKNKELKAQIQEQQVVAMQKIADKELKIVKLEEQNEKMKCCGNCSEPCWDFPIVRKSECLNNNYSLWELVEWHKENLN